MAKQSMHKVVEEIVLNAREALVKAEGLQRVSSLAPEVYNRNKKENRASMTRHLLDLQSAASKITWAAREIEKAIADNQAREVEELKGSTNDPEVAAFEQRLSRHDWHYCYSDDNRVFRSGEAEQKALRELATMKGGKFKELWEHYNNR